MLFILKLDFRSITECASLCQSNMDCSAFAFEAGSPHSANFCEIGIKLEGTTSSDPQLTKQIFLAVSRSGEKVRIYMSCD